MSLLTVERYRTLARDTTTADSDVEEAIVDAEQQLAEELRRPLDEAERTESYAPSEGRIYPTATPISAVVGDYTFDEESITVWGHAAFGDMPISLVDYPNGEVTVTYTGGWTSDTAPLTILQAIAEIAYRLTRTDPSVVAEFGDNVTSLRNGDVAVGFGSGGAGVATQDPLAGPKVQRARRYEWRPV